MDQSGAACLGNRMPINILRMTVALLFAMDPCHIECVGLVTGMLNASSGGKGFYLSGLGRKRKLYLR